nr:MAG TPA: hypothetical protein [Caudoviricetes sp.]
MVCYFFPTIAPYLFFFTYKKQKNTMIRIKTIVFLNEFI